MRVSKLEVTYTGLAYFVSFLFAAICVYPFLLIIMSSLSNETSLLQFGYSLIPHQFSLVAYQAIFSDNTIPRAYAVTTFVTVVGTALSLLLSATAAYALSGKNLYYRNYINFYFYFTMLFSGGLVPFYILITNYLSLYNSIWVYIIPYLLNPWNMFLMRNFFNDIPEELFESARIEGARELTILLRIVFPISLPALATIGLFYAIAYWSTWVPAMLFINNTHLYTLQYIIQEIIRNITMAQTIAVNGAPVGTPIAPSDTVRLATAVVTIGPIVLLYPFLQKYFVSGLRVGAIKG